mmetsp:Transcript_13108/g.34974  ORF Transcript_13108/g.34974 Transcript_13108/m.34974 type:complete len:257 (+) Transcript_13108:122-892(+)
MAMSTVMPECEMKSSSSRAVATSGKAGLLLAAGLWGGLSLCGGVLAPGTRMLDTRPLTLMPTDSLRRDMRVRKVGASSRSEAGGAARESVERVECLSGGLGGGEGPGCALGTCGLPESWETMLMEGTLPRENCRASTERTPPMDSRRCLRGLFLSLDAGVDTPRPPQLGDLDRASPGPRLEADGERGSTSAPPRERLRLGGRRLATLGRMAAASLSPRSSASSSSMRGAVQMYSFSAVASPSTMPRFLMRVLDACM